MERFAATFRVAALRATGETPRRVAGEAFRAGDGFRAGDAFRRATFLAARRGGGGGDGDSSASSPMNDSSPVMRRS